MQLDKDECHSVLFLLYIAKAFPARLQFNNAIWVHIQLERERVFLQRLFKAVFFFFLLNKQKVHPWPQNKSIVLFPPSSLSSVWIRSLLVRSYFSIWSLHSRLSALCLTGNLSHPMASGIGEPVLPVIRCLLLCYSTALVWGKVELRGRSVEAARSASLFGTLRTSKRSRSSVDNYLKPFPSNKVQAPCCNNTEKEWTHTERAGNENVTMDVHRGKKVQM